MQQQQPVIFVTGANGSCGSATVRHLQNKGVKILAGVHRDDDKCCEKLQGLNYTKVQIDGENKNLSDSFKGVDGLLIVPPQTENRAEICLNYVNSAVQANVKFLALISLTLADTKNLIFSEQWCKIEKGIRDSGIPYCFLRANFFMDNLCMNCETIKKENAFYAPLDGNIKITHIATDDIGAMAATVFTNMKNYHNTTLYASGDEGMCMNELAQLYTKVLKRDVKYNKVGEDEFEKTLVQWGVQQWQAKAITELYHQLGTGNSLMSRTGDFHKVVGRRSITTEQYLTSISHLHSTEK